MKLGSVLNNDVDNYYVTTCSLHGLNLTLSVLIEECIGSGGVGHITVMQVLFLTYDISQKYEKNEWKQKWFISTGKTYDKQQS